REYGYEGTVTETGGILILNGDFKDAAARANFLFVVRYAGCSAEEFTEMQLHLTVGSRPSSMQSYSFDCKLKGAPPPTHVPTRTTARVPRAWKSWVLTSRCTSRGWTTLRSLQGTCGANYTCSGPGDSFTAVPPRPQRPAMP